jgi:glycosyltransferase involved in cell wall biosynthesis
MGEATNVAAQTPSEAAPESKHRGRRVETAPETSSLEGQQLGESGEKAGPQERLRSLYVCYFPLTEPLVQTQVVAYLRGLAARGHVIHLMTYETEAHSPARRRFWKRELKKSGITWHGLRYHKRRHRLNCVHARAHVPAAVAWVLKRLTGARMLFDIRGLVAEEFEDAGGWKRDSLPFRVTKKMELIGIGEADGIVVLTERVRRVLFQPGYTPQPGPEAAIGRSPVQPSPQAGIEVIPCCADLSLIEAQGAERDAMRRELKLDGKTVMVYVGKFGGWYLQDEMADFFASARREIPDLHFLVLTQSEPEMIARAFERHGIDGSAYTLTRAPHERVGAYLAASDFALSFIAAMPSKIASSPTKIGEYLAAGLPVVCNPGVGDVDESLREHGVGVVVEAFDEGSYRAAARAVQELRAQENIAQKCKQAAHATTSLEEIGIQRYDRLYRHIARLVQAGTGSKASR